MSRKGPALKLLTPAEVAGMLHLSRRKVLTLPLPKVRVGSGRGKILFNEEDVKDYVIRQTEFPVEKGANNACRVQKNRKRWGFRFSQAGITHKKFAWHTKAEAKQAEAERRTELKNNPPPPQEYFDRRMLRVFD
jgi:hypothetical protein